MSTTPAILLMGSSWTPTPTPCLDAAARTFSGCGNPFFFKAGLMLRTKAWAAFTRRQLRRQLRRHLHRADCEAEIGTRPTRPLCLRLRHVSKQNHGLSPGHTRPEAGKRLVAAAQRWCKRFWLRWTTRGKSAP